MTARQITWRRIKYRRATPGNIVGAIANEARLAGQQINGVDVRATYSLVRLPAMLPKAVIERLSKVRIRGQALALDADGPPRVGGAPKPHRKGAKRQ
jgi:ATP-dependent RNA helicase DeaD